MSPYQDTSLVAYCEVLPNINKKQLEVWSRIQVHNSITNMELAYALNWSINRVTPRVYELRKMNLVELACTRTCQITHRLARAWRCKDD